MATLFHVTPRRNLKSILRRGILASKAIGRRKAVWAVARDMVWWALVHVTLRQACTLPSLMVIEVRVPDDWVKGHRGGLHYIPQDVPADRIVRVRSIKELAWR